MKNSLLALLLCSSLSAPCQYYYTDLRDAVANSEKMKAYLVSHVKSVTAIGFDAQGTKSSDFNEWQEIDAAGNRLKVTTRNGQIVSRQWYQFDGQGRLSGIVDSSGTIKSTTTYEYSGDRLVRINTVIIDSLKDFNETEEHQWQYGSNGKPEKMWRIVNGNDSSEYRFTVDEKGNVADERQYRRGIGLDPTYYYYDDSGRLTDIVRYNNRAKKLLPDFMFEYDEQNRVAQKITTLSTTQPNYLIWRYIYNDKGLKIKEALFNKQKELTGRIEYGYSF